MNVLRVEKLEGDIMSDTTRARERVHANPSISMPSMTIENQA